MTFDMTDVGPALTSARINAIEATLRISLPENYRQFLLRFNGGRPSPEFFPICGLELNPFGAIQIFFRIDGRVTSSNLDWNFRSYKGRIPKELLPIARDGMGNLICLSVEGMNKNCVYYWDHDTEHSPPSYDNVYLVAESFDKFLDSIHHEDVSAKVAEALGMDKRLH